MVEYKIKIGLEASRSLKYIYNWLSNNGSISIANRVREGLFESIGSLSSLPERHGLVQEIKNSKIEYRRITKWSYKIIYTINKNEPEVLIIDIIHSSRNPQILQDKFGQ